MILSQAYVGGEWAWGNATPGYGAKTGSIVSDDVNGDPRFGKETRGINTTIKVWKRTL